MQLLEHAGKQLSDVCRRQDLVALQKSTLGIQDIFQQEGLQVTDEEIENERSSAVMDFERNNQEFDKDRLNEQVVEVLKVRSCF